MVDGATASGVEESVVVDRWVARKVQPVVLLYVVLVFGVFMAASHFIFHSSEAVTALAVALLGGMAGTLPGVLERVEFRLTEAGIEKRSIKKEKPREFVAAFRWDELSSVIPTKNGFKFYKTIDESSRFRRFWKRHFSDRYSGEVQVERGDLERILEAVTHQGVTVS